MTDRRETAARRPVLAITLGLFAALGAANGAAMLAAPERWFWAIPGVANTGPVNLHFIKDVGMTYALMGVLLMIGAILPAHRAVLVSIVTAWYAAHALLHVYDISTGCLPPENWLTDLPGVFVAALLLMGLTAWAILTRRT